LHRKTTSDLRIVCAIATLQQLWIDNRIWHDYVPLAGRIFDIPPRVRLLDSTKSKISLTSNSLHMQAIDSIWTYTIRSASEPQVVAGAYA
jgi:hypothetical protein